MSGPKTESLSRDEVAVIYSILILADDDIPVTVDKINTILQAANVTVESIWPSLFAKALQNVNVRDLVSNVAGGVAVGAGVLGEAPGETAGQPAADDKPQQTAPAVEEDDSDEDFGLSLFD